MIQAPIQTILLAVSACLALALLASLVRRPALAYVRWYVVAGIACSLALDLLSLRAWLDPGRGDWIGPYLAAELLGAGAWLLFSRRFARPQEDRRPGLGAWGAVVAVAAASAGAVLAAPELLSVQQPSAAGGVIVLTTAGFSLRLCAMALLIAALTSLETTLVHSVHSQRWKIKFTILGCFAVLAAQMITMGLGLLYHSLDLTLGPARQTGFLIGMVLLLYSTLNRGGETPVKVSRRLARTSIVLFGSSAYLLFLGAFGVAISLTGQSDNRALILALGLVLGMGLLSLLLSEHLRRRFSRILQHYFYKEKYDYRIQWLAFTMRLAEARTREALHQAVLLGFCDTFGMGGGVLYLRQDQGQPLIPFQTWEIDPEPPVIRTEGTALAHDQEQTQVMELRTMDAGLSDEVTAFFDDIGAEYLVPLKKDDSVEGIVVLANPIDEKEEYGQEDFDLMEALACQAHSAILNLRLSDLLSQARDMEVMGKVSTFIIHDLKNLVYPLSLMVDNAKRHIADPEFQQDMLTSLENTISKMHVLISQLRRLPSRENLHQEDVDLAQLVQDTSKHAHDGNIVFTGSPARALADREQIRKVVLNLLLNAREASDNAAPIVVETGVAGEAPYFKVVDHGAGMSSHFIAQSLFQPFQTTKPKGMGIGLYQCKQIVEAHSGVIEVSSVPGQGSTFTVKLPAAATAVA